MPLGITGHKRIDLLKLGNRSINLWEYDEDIQREYIQTIAHMCKHAKVGDPIFTDICQGRAKWAKKANALFSTCGEFAQYLIFRAGYRGPILNRTVKEVNFKKKWVVGKNITYIVSRGRKAGAFIEYQLSKNKGKRPDIGDIIYVSNGPPRTEHVFYFDGIDWGPNGEELWVTIDGGQGGRQNQHIKEGVKVFNEKTGRAGSWDVDKERPKGKGRKVVGWLNPILLPFTAPANLRMPSAD
jgi:hypothetical protein